MIPEDLYTRVSNFSDDLYRNIFGIRHSQNLFDDLSDDPKEQQYAIVAESLSKPKTLSNTVIDRPFDYNRAITYPFLPDKWHSTRFSDGTRYGVWYGSLQMDTTVYETVYHWTKFISASYTDYPDEIKTDRRVVKLHCRALLVDLRPKVKSYPELIDPVSYDFTHQVGDFLHAQDQTGLITHSARHDGDNVALFKAKPLSNPRDHCFLTYRWTPGAPQVVVERNPGKTWLSVNTYLY